MTKYSLVLLKGFNTVAEFPIPEGATLLGRGLAAEDVESFINLEEFDVDLKVSKEHALITSNSLGAIIEDLASTNGTIINCTEELPANEPRYLRHGDQILIGKLLLEFRAEE